MVIRKAAGDIEQLRETLEDFVETPQALSVGDDFMLLSSAKFELAQSSAEPVQVDVTKRLGVDLMLPVASLLPLERRVLWVERMDIPRRVLETLADGAEDFAGVLASPAGQAVTAWLAKVPKVGPAVSSVAVPLLIAAAETAGPKLRELNEQARENRDYLTATLTQFKLDLEQGVKNRQLIRSLK